MKPSLTPAQSGELVVKPVFGICLGNQLLGVAAGATTYKVPTMIVLQFAISFLTTATCP